MEIKNIPVEKIKINSRFRNVSDIKLNDLCQSIETIGLINPIMIDTDYNLISGNHRLTSYIHLGMDKIPCQIVDKTLIQKQLIEIDENLVFNNLNSIEIGEHLIEKDKLLDELGTRSKQGNNRFTDFTGIKTNKDLSKELSQSIRSIQLKKQIVSNLSENVRNRLKSTPYANQTKNLEKLSKLHPVLQEKAVDLLDTEKRLVQCIQMVRRKRPELKGNLPLDERIKIYNQDFTKGNDFIQDNSIDLVWCDPPYITEDSLYLYEELSKLAKRVLKPGKRCIVYAYQPYLNDVLQVMGKHLKYEWMFCIKHHNSYQNKPYRIGYKPLLVFTKGKGERLDENPSDLITTSKEKEFIDWQQSEMDLDYYLPFFTKENDLVLDCMAGSGTTGVSCFKHNCRFIGIEKNIETFNIMKSRLLNL